MPAGTDCIEMKIRFLTTANQALYCARATDAYHNSFTAFISSGKFRFDHGRVGPNNTPPETDVDYEITADGCTRFATVKKMKDGATTTITMGDHAYSADFEGEYVLSLLASHTAGANLSASSSMSFPASARLYYVKIYDKDGALVRDYVPVRNDILPVGGDGAGLYDKLNNVFIGNSGGGMFAVGADTGASAFQSGEGDVFYEKTVAAGDTVDLTADEVAAATGKIFVKRGPGTLNVGDVMADFAGEIRILEGCYVVKSSGALGTAAGITRVAGGTLVNEVGVASTMGTDVVFAEEEIRLFGTGYDNHGALWNKVYCVAFARQIALDGDALIVSDSRLDFRGTTFTMSKNKLTIDCPNEGYNSAFYFNTASSLTTTFVQMGDIEMRGRGTLWFVRSVGGISDTATVTIRSGAQLSLYDMWGYRMTSKLVFEPGARLYCEANGNPVVYNEAETRNVIEPAGSIFEMRGIVTNALVKNTQWAIRSKMTGLGGIVGGVGGYLKMDNPSNDFTGGLDISGVVENGEPIGGIVSYANGAIPNGTDAGAVKLTDAILRLLQANQFDLPDFVAAGRVIVSNDAVVTTCNVRSVKKTGTEELMLVGPFNVQGTAAFDAGTVRLATQVPEGTTSAEEAAKYRASFAGNVAFGPGAVIDVGDRTPYLPIVVPSLTGLPTVKNGALEVASATWTIRKDDILDADDKPLNKPLTLENAALTFPAGPVTIDLSEEDAEALKPLLGTVKCPLIANAAAFSANAFKLSERAKMSGFGLSVQKGQLVFGTPSGTLVIVR